jgi:VRR-NUC domain
MKEKSPTEYEFHLQVAKFLNYALDKNSMWAHCPNGGYRHATEAKRLKAMGVMPGLPDILILNNGRATWVELKREKRAYLSPAQAHCHKRLLAAGSPVSVCRNLDDLEAALVAAGIPIKARTQ